VKWQAARARDTFELPRPLFDFFLQQIDKYAGASDSTLQQIRYLREGVFLKDWSAETAASYASATLIAPDADFSRILSLRGTF